MVNVNLRGLCFSSINRSLLDARIPFKKTTSTVLNIYVYMYIIIYNYETTNEGEEWTVVC